VLGVARSFPWVVREREREFQPYFFFFFVRFSGSDVKSCVTGSGQCHRDLRRGAGGGGGEQPAMTATGCFFSAEHQHNLLHKSGEYHHHLPLLLLLLIPLLYNLIYKQMILRVSEDCVWNLRGGRNVNRRVPEAKEHMCLWKKKGQFHLHSIERTPVPETKERCVFGEIGTSSSTFNRKKSSARRKRKMYLWRKDDISITNH
jgi:hypothetical protein